MSLSGQARRHRPPLRWRGSGDGSPQDHAASRQAGFAGPLVKPPDPGEVDALLRRVLESRAAR